MDQETTSRVRKAIRLHYNWFIRSIAGDDALSAEELAELKAANLPRSSIDFVKKSFFLGRLSALLSKKEYASLSSKKLKKAIKETKLTELEKLTLVAIQQSTASQLRSYAVEVETGIFSKIDKAQLKIISEATVKDLIKDEVAFAVIKKKAWKDLAQELGAALNVSPTDKKLERIARTELHSAKQQGIVQAISNKVDIYQHSQGPNSRVSVVTEKDRCKDCASLYELEDGTPRIFILSDLLANGFNTDRKHTKTDGVHTHWKPSVPPLHPHCFCTLRYVPPGYAWEGRKLVLKDRTELLKAFGDSALSTVGKPKGPPQPNKPPSPGNVPGLAAPKSSPAGGTPGGSSSPGGSGIEYEYWSGDGAPPADGGYEQYERRDGGTGFRRPAGSGPGKQPTEEDEEKHLSQKIEESINWGKANTDVNAHLKNLKEAAITSVKELGQAQKGIHDSFIVSLEGGQRALMKPVAFSSDSERDRGVRMGLLPTEGARSVPVGTGHKREVAAFKAHQMLGLTEHVPPTATRTHDGKDMSFQSWGEGFSPVTNGFNGDEDKHDGPLAKMYFEKFNTTKMPQNATVGLLALVPDDKKDQVIEKLSEGAVAAMVLNNNDQHMDNVIVNGDWDVRFVDNSVSFGNGMDGAKVQIHRDFHNSGRKLKIPEKLHAKLKNTSLGDIRRAVGNEVEDWAVGQTFLRMKYLAYLQDTEGHLDFEKFRPNIGSGHEIAGHSEQPRHGMWYSDPDESVTEFKRRKEEGLLARQLFDSFAKQWMIDATGPDREVADELQKIGVFNGLGIAVDKDYRRDKKHLEYEKTIKPGYPPRNVGKGISEGLSDKPSESFGASKTELPRDPNAFGEFAYAKTQVAEPEKPAPKVGTYIPPHRRKAAEEPAKEQEPEPRVGTYIPPHRRRKGPTDDTKKSLRLYIPVDARLRK